MTRTVIADLLERVRKAEGPDRGLDAALACTLLGGHPSAFGGYRLCDGVHHSVDRITASMDAALALVERVLPEYGYRLQTQLGGRLPVCTLHAPPADPDASITDGRSWSKQFSGGGATSSLAILAALLTALTEGGDHGE